MRILTYTNPSGTSLTLGAGTDYHIDSLEGIDAGGADDQTQKAPFQDGVTWVDTLLTARTVHVQGHIISRDLTSIFAHRNELLGVLNPKLGPGTLSLTYDGGIKILNAIPSPGPQFKNKHFKSPFQEYLATFKAHDPFWYDQNPTTSTFMISVPLFSSDGGVASWRWPAAGVAFSSRNPLSVLVLNNSGHVLAPVSAIITGPAVNPKILLQNTGQYLKFNTTLAAKDQIQVSTAFGKKSVVLARFSQAPVNGMSLLAVGSQFFSLGLGDNTLQFSDDSSSTTASMQFTYSNRYTGV